MRRDIAALNKRMEDDLQVKLVKLEKLLRELTERLQRNDADVGANVDRLAEDMRDLRGVLSQLGADPKLAEVEQRLAILELSLAKPAPTADDSFTEGKTAYAKKDHNTAAKYFSEFLSATNESDPKRAEATFLLGESFRNLGKMESAQRQYQRVYDQYPKSNYADDGLFQAGVVAEGQKRCREARAYFLVLAKRYPSSNYKRAAVAKEKELRKRAKSSKYCR